MSLYSIVKNNLIGQLEAKIAQGNVDVNSLTGIGHCYTLLEVSIAYGAWECFQTLLKHGAHINHSNTKQYKYDAIYPIDVAVEKIMKDGDRKYFDVLYAKDDLWPIYGLQTACSKKTMCNIEVFKQLLEHPNLQHDKYASLSEDELHLLSVRLVTIGRPEFFEVLLEKSFPVNWRYIMNDLILNNKSVDNIKMLIDHGIDINTPYNGGSQNFRAYHPIMAAASKGNLGIVKLLIEHKAYVNIENDAYDLDGNKKIKITPLYMAASLKYYTLHDHLKYNEKTQLNIMQALLKAGADAKYICPNNNKTILHVAIEQNISPSILKLLMKYGATIDTTKNYKIYTSWSMGPINGDLIEFLHSNGILSENINYQ